MPGPLQLGGAAVVQWVRDMSRGMRRRGAADATRRNRRAMALERTELRTPTDGVRRAPAGATSAAIRDVDAETRAMIDAALEARGLK